MKILSVLSGKNDGSSYFRLEQPSHFFSDSLKIRHYRCIISKFSSLALFRNQRKLNYVVNVFWDKLKFIERLPILAEQHAYDYVWFSRSLLGYPSFLNRSVRNFIYDFDDAVWLSDAKYSFSDNCKHASIIIAGNNFLANEAKKHNNKIAVIPTSVNINRYKKTAANKDQFIIGHIGSSSGFKYLVNILNHFRQFFNDFPDARLMVVSDRYPKELNAIKQNLIFKPWSRESDVEAINQFTIGIMPLENSIWERGKCSFKMLQYMSCEIPVVVSAVGMNEEVMQFEKQSGKFGSILYNDNEWYDAFKHYYQVPKEELEQMGSRGRDVIANNFSTQFIAQKIEKAFYHYL